MSWTQVYVTGLSETEEPSDEELERLLDERYHLSNDDAINWAGPGTTLVKRDKDTGACRGYAFLALWTVSGATTTVERINNNIHSNTWTLDDSSLSLLPLQLRAELSQPKKTKKKSQQSADSTHTSDDRIRLRRKRAATARKHPVIVSSDKSKTGLGNKTK